MTDFSLIFQVSVESAQRSVHATPVISGINPAFRSVLGYAAEDITGKPIQDIFYRDEDRRKFQCAVIAKVLSEQVMGGLELDLKSKSGCKVPVNLSFTPLYHSKNKGHDVVCIARHSGMIESVERALSECHERFHQMSEMVAEWLWEQDPLGHYTYSSSAVTDILGYSPEEVIGKGYSELFSNAEYRNNLPKGDQSNEKVGSFYKVINQYRHRDGHTISTESTGCPVFDSGGVLVKWRGVDRDITETKRVEEEIRKAHVKLAVSHHEMKIARRIQESLLPSGPLIAPGVRVEGFCLSADQVGGDYFDYFCRDNDTVDVVIADVSGHAVGPALFMVETRSALRTQAQMITEPGETLFLMNGFLYQDLSQSDHFITMFYLQYCSATRKLNYANAGHSPPLLMRKGANSCQPMDADGLVLGVKEVVVFEQKEEILEPGDLVFLYTDGLTEAQRPDGEFFGVSRLCKIISENAHMSADQLMSVCVEKLKAFRETDVLSDDLTMVVVNIVDEIVE